MHTQQYDYTPEDIKYSSVERILQTGIAPQPIHFHYNSDLSGEVYIVAYDESGELKEVSVPGWMILEFVGRYCASEAISTIEGYSGRDFLRRMVT